MGNRHLEGVGRYTYEIMQRMVAAYPEHHFFFFFDRAYDPKFIFADNVTGVVLPIAARHPFLFILYFELITPAYLKKFQIDVYLSFDNQLSLSTGVDQVLVVHDLAYLHYPQFIPLLHRWYYQFFMPKFIAKASSIVAVSQFTASDISNHFPNAATKIVVATNALASGFEKALEGNSKKVDQPYFILPGAIHQRKNTYNILKAFLLYTNKYHGSHKLMVVGRFMWKGDEKLMALWKKLIDMELLWHFENVSDTELIESIRSSTALLYVSLFEGFGLPVLEGMACGVPVITSNVSSLPEVAGDGAIKVDPNDIESMAEAMHDISSDDVLKNKMIKAGKERVNTFNWTTSMEQIASLVFNHQR